MDLNDWDDRLNYARKVRRDGAMKPTVDHLTLLARSYWDMSECEFGAPEMDGKRPYGNGDVEDDLAELLPHLSEQERLRVHCELPSVLTWVCRNALDEINRAVRGKDVA